MAPGRRKKGLDSRIQNDPESGRDEKEDKQRREKAHEESFFMFRIFCILVSLLLIIFYDAASIMNRHKTDNSIATDGKNLVRTERKKFESKYSYVDREKRLVFDDTNKVILTLNEMGAVPRMNMDAEDRIMEYILENDVASMNENDIDMYLKREGLARDHKLISSSEQVRNSLEAVQAKIEKKRISNGAVDSIKGYVVKDMMKIIPSRMFHDRTLEDYFTKVLLDDDDLNDQDAVIQGGEKSIRSGKQEKSDAAIRETIQVLKQFNRSMVYDKRDPDEDFEIYVKELRAENIFGNILKKNDMERALKEIGYKQKAKNSKRQPLWIGNENSKCSDLKTEAKISFCPFHIPLNKASHYAYFKEYAEKNPSIRLTPDYYPLTWRLYKEKERSALKLHASQEGIGEYEISYVRKFTVPGSNYMKSAGSVYEQLEKSSRSNKLLTKESKNKAIVQLYINDPLLLDDRKFIIRTYALVVDSKPFIVFYSDGAVMRSLVKYTRFTTLNGDYKKAAHITSEQKGASKGPLKSSELYMHFRTLQRELVKMGFADDYLEKDLRPQMRARMIHALYAIKNRQRGEDEDEEESVTPEGKEDPKLSVVVQTICFDFLLDVKKKLWMINLGTGSHCFVNMGGSSFRPSWKARLQEQIGNNAALLAEELLWRKKNKKVISSMAFFTDTGMVPLIDETFPDWNVKEEIHAHMDGKTIAQERLVIDSDDDGSDDDVVVHVDNDDDGQEDDSED